MEPILIDGAAHSGSGTIVRFATALAAVLGRPLHLVNARVRRPKPGLRAQHAAAVRACAELCDGDASGLEIGSRELRFRPRAPIRGGRFAWDIGTSGSATMLALGVLPVACFADAPIVARITGGVFQDFAPSPFHMQHVLAPLLARMGASVEVEVVRAGYVPRGAGVLELRVRPAAGALAPLRLAEAGRPRAIAGIALASHLAERDVAERMARACEERLLGAGLAARIERVDDVAALHAGAGLAVWCETSAGCRLGADRAGARGRRSEDIGGFVADQLLADLATGATVDRHLADQLLPFVALARGASLYRVPVTSDHLAANAWLVEQFGATVRIAGQVVEVVGVGARRRR